MAGKPSLMFRLVGGAMFIAVALSGSASAEIKGDAIRIGVLTDMSGIFATAMGPGSVEAARMAAEDFGGKINGKPIEILQADHQNKADVASAIARAKLDKLGVKVAGSVKTALNTADFASFLLQAQSSGAKVLALNAAGDNVTIMKQAQEFGFAQQGIAVVPMTFQNVDIVAAGLSVTQGDLIATSFFEDVSPAARKWADAFFARRKAMPSQIQAGVYSAVRHYLQAVKDTDSDDGEVVMARMKATPVVDAYTPQGTIRADQRMVHDLYLVQVKTPAESKGPWDLVKLVTAIKPDEAFRSLEESKCPLVGR